MIAADKRGITSHGIRQLPRYLDAFDLGAIDPAAEPRVVHRRGATAVIDAGHGLGHPAASFGMTEAIDRAEKLGVGVSVIRNSNHFGAAFYYALQASERGMIGFVTTSAVPVMAPFGGADVAIGNNPLAWALPTESGAPVLLDMACSVGARGKIRRAAIEGQRIPRDWALDRDGRPTDDPNEALKGVLASAAGPKGYGLAVVNELLSGGLSDSNMLGRIPDEVVRSDRFERSMDVGHFVMALNISALIGLDTFLANAEWVRSELVGVRPAAGTDRVRLPGDIENDRFQSAERSGRITVDPSTLRQLGELLEDASLQVPSDWLGVEAD